MPEPILLAVDGNSLLHRSFHAQASTAMRDTQGQPIWGVRGLVSQILAAVERIDPEAVIVGFDDPDRSMRRERWPHYKATRVEKPPTLHQQLQLAVQLLTELGLRVVVPNGLEADDVLASAARHAKQIGARTVVVTSDRDSFALIDETTSVLRVINGGVEASPLLTPARLPVLLGINAGQYRDFAALRGDASDNLSGVNGFGAKTAAKLLNGLGSVTQALADLDGDGKRVIAAVGPAAARRLSSDEAREAWRQNCEVMAFDSGIDIDVDLKSRAGMLPVAVGPVRSVFERLQLKWTLPKALELLAHTDGRAEYRELQDKASLARRAGIDSATRHYVGSGPKTGTRSWSPLTRKAHEKTSEQLTLFE